MFLKHSILTILLVFGTISALGAGHAEAQDSFSWKYWAGRQGTYKVGWTGETSKKIRFINIQFDGEPSVENWDRAFRQAASFYEKKGITFPRQRDDVFESVSGLNNQRQRIVGWADETTKKFGYVVIKKIVGSKVHYYSSKDRSNYTMGPNPDNFIRWQVGRESGDWVGTATYASIQVWKHTGASNSIAAVSLRLDRQTIGEKPYK